jgi:ACT domain-containing protein
MNSQQTTIDVYMQENDRLKTAYIQVSMDRKEAKSEAEQKLKEMRGDKK